MILGDRLKLVSYVPIVARGLMLPNKTPWLNSLLMSEELDSEKLTLFSIKMPRNKSDIFPIIGCHVCSRQKHKGASEWMGQAI